jgi:hypothetical protein
MKHSTIRLQVYEKSISSLSSARCAASLHSHTHFSQNTLTFLPHYASQVPILGNLFHPFWYDGIVSTVEREGAQTEIFYFPLTEEVTIDGMPRVLRAFEDRTRRGEADKSRCLENRLLRYKTPQGFLICLQRMMAHITGEFKSGSGKENWLHLPLLSTYVYNAGLYQLQVEKVKTHKTFELSHPKDSKIHMPSGNRFQNVAEADFKIVNTTSKERHSFTCWFPMGGPLESIPIQI